VVRDGKGKAPVSGARKGQTHRLKGLSKASIALFSLAFMPIAGFASEEADDLFLTAGSAYVAGQQQLTGAQMTGTLDLEADVTEADFEEGVINWLEVRSGKAATMGRLLLTRTNNGFKLDVGSDRLELDWRMRF